MLVRELPHDLVRGPVRGPVHELVYRSVGDRQE